VESIALLPKPALRWFHSRSEFNLASNGLRMKKPTEDTMNSTNAWGRISDPIILDRKEILGENRPQSSKQQRW
jgi:hypothetical protein